VLRPQLRPRAAPDHPVGARRFCLAQVYVAGRALSTWQVWAGNTAKQPRGYPAILDRRRSVSALRGIRWGRQPRRAVQPGSDPFAGTAALRGKKNGSRTHLRGRVNPAASCAARFYEVCYNGLGGGPDWTARPVTVSTVATASRATGLAASIALYKLSG